MSPKIDDIELLARIAGRSVVRQRLGRCIRLRGGAGCSACRDACALSLPLSEPESILDDKGLEQCLRCGACTAACPTEALYLAGGTYGSWLQQVRDSQALVALDSDERTLSVACSVADLAECHMSVGCLRAWDASIVLYAWSLGVGKVELHAGDCTACIAGGETAGSGWVELLQDIGGSLVPRRGVTLSSHVTGAAAAKKTPTLEGTHDRRSFLTSARVGAFEAIRTLMNDKLGPEETTREDERGAGEGSLRREVGIAALKRLMPDPIAASSPPAVAQHLAVDTVGTLATRGPKADKERCNLCGDCARFCPTGALSISEREGSLRLSLSPDRCIGCGLCVELCLQDALRMHDRGLAGAVRGKRLILVRRDVVLCERCGEPFGQNELARPVPPQQGEKLLCPVCKRSEERFGGLY